MAIKWIVFDLGGVIVDLNRESSVVMAMELTGCTREQAINILIETQDLDKPELTLLEQFMSGSISSTEYLQSIKDNLAVDVSLADIEDVILAFINGEKQETLQLIKLLHQHYPLACLSNTHELHWNYMHANYQCFNYFQVQMASHLAQLIKPDLEIFHYAEKQLKAEPYECLFIDDSPKNVDAARVAGWDACVFESAENLSRDLQERKLIP